MKLQEVQNWVADDWQKYPENHASDEQQLLLLVEEVGEVAEAVRILGGRKDRVKNVPDIGSEMADVLISLITLANTYKVDLATEVKLFQQKLENRRAT